MPLHLTSPPAAETPLDATESRMREALGIRDRAFARLPQQRPEDARQRHRFVRDGEVPVVVVNGRKEQDNNPSGDPRIAAMQAVVASEKAARALADRALQEAQATIQTLQTRLAHVELAHSEALAAERARREQAERALQDSRAPRERAQPEQRNIAAPAASEPRKRGRPKKIAPTAPSTKATRVKKAREPQPVKWWLPSYRAKAHKR